MTSLSDIRIILVNTSHPGNIGSVARAMKTMGLQELYLVSPKNFPDPQATALAANAGDILLKAKVVPDLVSALTDVHFVYATSANQRDNTLPLLSAREAAIDIITKTAAAKTAIVFGPENYGLDTTHLYPCHYLIQIPTAQDYHSLNLGAAVQIVTYELLMASSKNEVIIKQPLEDLADVSALENFYHNLQVLLIQLEIIDPARPGQMIWRLRQLFNRAQLTQSEINILRGIFKALKK